MVISLLSSIVFTIVGVVMKLKKYLCFDIKQKKLLIYWIIILTLPPKIKVVCNKS